MFPWNCGSSVVMVEPAMDTGMVWPLAVRNTVSRASGAGCEESNALRCTSSMKPTSGLPSSSFSPKPSSRCAASLQLFTTPSGEVTSTASLRLLSTVFR